MEIRVRNRSTITSLRLSDEDDQACVEDHITEP